MLNDEELRRVSSLAHRQVEAEAAVLAAEAALEEAKKNLNHISQQELPLLMAELQLESFKLRDGTSITVKPKYYAGISVYNRQRAFLWLREHNCDGIIKNVVKCDFGKGEDAVSAAAMRALVDLGLRPVQDSSVHPSTLKSFIKDLFERGVDFPVDVFGAGVVNESKVTLAKVKP